MLKRYVLILFSFLVTFTYSFAANYYWVGGSGNWSDLTKWATTSGGTTKHVIAPSSLDDVFFDANSFTGNAQTVTVDVAGVCRHMDWTDATTTYSGAVNGPRIYITNQLEVFGNFKLVTGMRPVLIGHYKTLFFSSNSTGRTIETQGVALGDVAQWWQPYVKFSSSTGGWTLQDSITCTGGIYFDAGSFNSNGKPITTGSMYTESSNVRTLNFNNSRIKIVGYAGNYAWFNFNATNLTFSNTNTIITFTPIGGSAGASIINYGPAITWNRVINYFPTLNQYSANGDFFTDVFNLNGKIAFSGHVNFVDTVFVASGQSLTFGHSSWWTPTFTFGASSKLVANGTCAKPIIIDKYDNAGQTFTLAKTGGWTGISVSYCYIKGIKTSGGGTISATNSYDLGGNSGISFTAPAATSYYWIGGSGHWHDGTHWSLSSGGAASGCIPSYLDDVFFDANSFPSAASKTVSIDSASAYCRNMNWTGALNNPIFQNSSYAQSFGTLNIYGSLTFISGMTFNVLLPTYFESNTTANITSATKSFQRNVYLNGRATYNLLDAFTNVGTNGPYWGSVTGGLYLNKGTLNTNNNQVTVRHFNSIGDSTRTLNMGSSTFLINNHEGLTPGWYERYNWDVRGSNMTLNCGTSKIHIDNDVAANGTSYTRFYGANKTYNLVWFKNAGSTIPEIWDFRADSVLFDEKAKIHNNNIVDGVMVLNGAKTYTFDGGATTTFNGILNADGACRGIVEIKSSTSSRAIFTKTSGSIGTVNNVSLEKMEGAGGATYSATNSSDFGGNVGWTIGAAIPRTLYWVGGTGNWSDNARWSLTSGGAGGNCPPTRIDNVIFNNSSFSASGQTVTVDVTDANFKDMTWSVTLYTPVFTGTSNKNLNVYGSLTYCAALTYSFSGTTYFRGTGNITMAGKVYLSGAIFDCGTGSYTLQDNFNITNHRITFITGTFNSNGKSVFVRELEASFAASPGFTFNCGSSSIYVYFYYSVGGTQASWNQPATGNTNYLLNAGTSTFYSYGYAFYAGNSTFNRIEFLGDCAYNGTNTVRVARFNANVSVTHSNTFVDSVSFLASKTITFLSGVTQYFGCSTFVDLVGSPGPVITLQSSTGGSQASFSKPCGRVCADYIWLKDINATGGASWKTGANADDKGGNAGWDMTPYVPVGNGVLSGGATACPASAQTLTFNITGPLPVDLTYSINDGSTTSYVTIAGVAATPHTVTVYPTITSTYALTSIFRDDCIGGSGTASGSAVFTVKNGTAGLWDGSLDTDWFNCANWADGVVPLTTTNVTIPNGLARYPVIAAAGAVCNNITIASGGSNPSLTINNSLSTLTVYGNFTLNGSFTHTNGLVTFTGTATNQLGGTADYNFYNLTINNANNVTMSRSITVNNVLNLNAGSLGIGSNTLTLLGTLTGSATLSGTINSILNISGSGALGTLRFAAGARIVGNLNMNRSATGTVTLGSPLVVNSSVSFTNGIINTSSTNYLEFADNASYSNVSDNSHVNGPVRKTGNDAFIFPIGKGGRYQWCAITAPTTVTDAFTAEYFAADGSVVFGSARVASLTFLSKCNYWLVDRNAGSSAISLRLSWNQYSCGSLVGAANLLKVAHWNGTQWIDEGNGGYNVTGANEGNVISANSISNFSPFTLGSPSSNNPLPIELLSFSAKLNFHQQVDLQWITATETNNDYFTVERSADGFAFEGIITTKGAGNSTSAITYDKIDYSPLSGLSYYRLKQTDFDGKFSYSQIVPIEYTETVRDFTLYPNPVIRNGSDNITFQLEGLVKDSSVLLVLRDVLGKEFYSKIILTDNIGNIKLAIESSEPIPAGIYIISATSNNQLMSKKVIIQ